MIGFLVGCAGDEVGNWDVSGVRALCPHQHTHRPHGRLGTQRLDVRARKPGCAVHHVLNLGRPQRVAVLAQQERDERMPGLDVGEGNVEALDEPAARGLVELVGAVGGADDEDAVLFSCLLLVVVFCALEVCLVSIPPRRNDGSNPHTHACTIHIKQTKRTYISGAATPVELHQKLGLEPARGLVLVGCALAEEGVHLFWLRVCWVVSGWVLWGGVVTSGECMCLYTCVLVPRR